METWRPMPGFPGYEVSDHGRVRSWRQGGRPGLPPRKTPKLLKLRPRDAYGHLGFSARADGVTHAVYVHRWVLIAFVGPAPEGADGCHNDGDKLNNRLDNLRWDTRSANIADRMKHGTHGTRLDLATVRSIRASSESAAVLAARHGVSDTTIYHIRTGHTWRDSNV